MQVFNFKGGPIFTEESDEDEALSQKLALVSTKKRALNKGNKEWIYLGQTGKKAKDG